MWRRLIESIFLFVFLLSQQFLFRTHSMKMSWKSWNKISSNEYLSCLSKETSRQVLLHTQLTFPRLLTLPGVWGSGGWTGLVHHQCCWLGCSQGPLTVYCHSETTTWPPHQLGIQQRLSIK
jgi:hypothetical protein